MDRILSEVGKHLGAGVSSSPVAPGGGQAARGARPRRAEPDEPRLVWPGRLVRALSRQAGGRGRSPRDRGGASQGATRHHGGGGQRRLRQDPFFPGPDVRSAPGQPGRFRRRGLSRAQSAGRGGILGILPQRTVGRRDPLDGYAAEGDPQCGKDGTGGLGLVDAECCELDDGSASGHPCSPLRGPVWDPLPASPRSSSI